MKRNTLFKYIKKAIYSVEPKAEIILFGSRARKDSSALSDWDLLILVTGIVDDERIDKIRYQLYEVEWKYGEIISSIIKNKDEWHSFPLRTMPLYKQIENDGILL